MFANVKRRINDLQFKWFALFLKVFIYIGQVQWFDCENEDLSTLRGKSMLRGLVRDNYISSRSDFDFKFTEICVIEKRLPDSPSRGVDKNAYRYKCFQTFESINGVSTLQHRLIFG
jgi:hypothetical protein